MLFVGWFGPRGLASIVFLILAVHGLDLDPAQIAGEVPYEAVVWTILLSVVLHGVSATPLARAYGRRAGPPRTTSRAGKRTGCPGGVDPVAASAPRRRRPERATGAVRLRGG